MMSRPAPESGFVVLAGGESRRMGRDKALLNVGGRPLLVRVVEAAAGACPRGVIVSNRPAKHGAALRTHGWLSEDRGGRQLRRNDRRLRIVQDVHPGRGPVAGLEAGLAEVGTDICWTIACDLPFVTPGMGRLLVRELDGRDETDAVVPEVGGRPQPLCAAYRRRVATVAGRCLTEERYRMEDVLARITVWRLPGGRLDQEGEPARLLLNVNRPDELARARRIFGVSP